MLFCPKCGSLLKTKADGKKLVYFCSCGYSKQSASKEIIKEKVVHSDVIVEVSGINPLATADHVCGKCGFEKAVLVSPEIAVRETAGCCEGDRPAYVCGKCGFKEFL